MKQNKIAIVGVSAAMLLGAGAGLMLTLPSGAGASGNSTTVVEPDTDTDERGPGGGLTDSLDELVTAGTITQEQADAITAAIKANRPEGGHGGPGGMGGMGGHRGRGGFGGGKFAETAAEVLGITADELKTELEAGNTIADVAAAKGIDVQTVIDAIVATETANITERVTNRVNGVQPEKPVDTTTEDTTTEDSTTEDSGGS